MPERAAAVLLGGETIAVSAARSLAPAGVPVYALGDPVDPVQRSRHCARFVDVGSGDGVQDRYLRWLVEEAPAGAVVIPCDDDGIELIARSRAVLEEHGLRPVEADDGALLAILDKERTYELCREHGIPCPRTARLESRGDAERAAAEFDYPCALKPRESHVFAQHFGILAKAVRVHSPEELVEQYERTAELGISMLCTEIVPGRDDALCSYYSYLDEAGEPLYHFTKRKLRQYPPEFGLGSLQRTTWDPDLAELGLRFFQGIGLRGIGNVEFKRDSRDGVPKLIECNARLTAANEQVRLAGLDIPLLAYSRVAGGPGPELGSYTVGLSLWHPIEDLRALRQYRRRGEWSVWSWLRSLTGRVRFPLWRLDDPGPTIHSFQTKLRRRGRRLRGGGAQAATAAAIDSATVSVDGAEASSRPGARS